MYGIYIYVYVLIYYVLYLVGVYVSVIYNTQVKRQCYAAVCISKILPLVIHQLQPCVCGLSYVYIYIYICLCMYIIYFMTVESCTFLWYVCADDDDNKEYSIILNIKISFNWVMKFFKLNLLFYLFIFIFCNNN